MKRETKWYIVWIVAIVLAVFTDNFFLDVILAAATAIFVTVLIFGDRKTNA